MHAPHEAVNSGMNLDAIAVGKNPPEDINVIIEVPVGGEPIKYEMDKASGALFVDRYLYTSMRYPGNYGFVPHTLSDDGDPIDVLVASTRAITPGAVMNCRPIGVLVMTDEAGQDEKVIAVPSTKLSSRYEQVMSYTQLPKITLEQIEHFFVHYKDLERDKWVRVDRWGDADDAKRLIQVAIDAARVERPQT
jgi:inorganic pyrophosphatase